MQDKDKDLCMYRFNLAKETLANAKMCLLGAEEEKF
jgi:hypothetical protein